MKYVSSLVLWLLLSVLPLVPRDCRAADDPEPDLSSVTPDAAASQEASPDEVAATVNGEPIKMGDVNDAVRTVLQGRPPNRATLKMLQAEVLSQLIDRALILQMLEKSGKGVDAAEITKAIEELKKQAEEKKVDWDKTMAEKGITDEKLFEQLNWQMNWGKFAQKELTDSMLRKYYAAHKRDYDGTEVRVSHILLRPDGIGSVAETERLKQMALKLREQIESGKLTFEDAAKKISAGPSRRKGGDLGFIPRQGLMLDQFATTAFKLEKDKISDPVVTPYGVHLIKVTDEKPGRKLLSEVKDQLKAPAAQEVFDKLATAEREKADIEFTDKCPHFKPGTRELASE